MITLLKMLLILAFLKQNESKIPHLPPPAPFIFITASAVRMAVGKGKILIIVVPGTRALQMTMDGKTERKIT